MKFLANESHTINVYSNQGLAWRGGASTINVDSNQGVCLGEVAIAPSLLSTLIVIRVGIGDRPTVPVASKAPAIPRFTAAKSIRGKG